MMGFIWSFGPDAKQPGLIMTAEGVVYSLKQRCEMSFFVYRFISGAEGYASLKTTEQL